MGEHSAERRHMDAVVHDPDAPKVGRAVWWGAQRLPFLLPLGGVVVAARGHLLLGAGIVLATFTASLGLRLGSGVRIGPYAGIVLRTGQALTDWRQAEDACRVIGRSWPDLGDLAEPRDIGPALRRAQFQLAQLLAARTRLDRSVRELASAHIGLARDDPLRARLAGQRDVLVERHRALDAEIAGRLGALRRLARSSGEHAHHERSAVAARQTLRRVERAAGNSSGLPAADTLGGVNERMEAVLGAYRELVAQFGDGRR